MFPFRNILFPTDFSTHSRCALKYAAAFARNGNGRLVILNAQDTALPPNLLTIADHELSKHDNQSLLQIKLRARELLKDALLDGLDVEPVVVEGEPAATIRADSSRLRNRPHHCCHAWSQTVLACVRWINGGRHHC
jgi:nucleotide-binding universal stress UspA family protein